MKLDFKKMSQLQGGEGGVKTFSNFLKIRCPNMGGGEGGSTRLGQVQVLHFFLSHPLLILKGFLEKCQVQLWIY